MANETIRGIKMLKKGGIVITYINHKEVKMDAETIDVPLEHKVKIYGNVNPSFIDSLNILRAHLICITELGNFTPDGKYLKQQLGSNDVRLERFRVTEISWSGDEGDESEAVILKGLRKTKRNTEIPFGTDKIALFNTNDYEYSGNLHDDLKLIKRQALDILDGEFVPLGYQFSMQLS